MCYDLVPPPDGDAASLLPGAGGVEQGADQQARRRGSHADQWPGAQ